MRDDPKAVLGEALAGSISAVRRELGDPTAAIGVVVPSDATAVLLKQQLALAGPFIRVEFLTPERLVGILARPHTPDGWSAQPVAWLPTTVLVLLRKLGEDGSLGPHGDALRQPGWHLPVARAVERLESAGLRPDDLGGFEDPTLAQRAAILAAVLRAVQDRRARDRLLALSDACELALRALQAASHGPGHRPAGAVLFGDRILSPDVYQVLATWLSVRPHRVLNPPPLSHLDPAPRGLRAAALGPEDIVHPAAEGTVGALQQRLYRSFDGAGLPLDDSLAIVTTPDEVRDVSEAVREVLRAVGEGVPLDRIAVVLPDTQQADVLQSALDAAGVPTTWLTGPSLARAPEARGLLLAADTASGQDTVRQWYALLSHPGLNLRRGLGAEAATGRGRWRRILARCGAVRGSQAILDALARWVGALEADAEDDRAAAESLALTIRTLSALFATWRTDDTLGGHGARFVHFLRTWWRPSARSERLAHALNDWGAPGVGFRVSLAHAVGELRDTLARAPDLDGKLTERRIRVLTPMLCLGGAFDRLVVTGLTQKRLPAEIREDPLLPDALLDALSARHGVTLLTSRVLAEFEQRRFAAVVGACSGRLWLAAPELEMLTERPLLPSTHLLAVQSVLSGRRAGFSELRRTAGRAGSRARPFPSDPDDAIGGLEFGIASARHNPELALSDLAARADSRRLLALHRALDADMPTPWTGRVTPGLLNIEGLDGEDPLPANQLRALLVDPADFFFRRVLGAWGVRELPDAWDPCNRYTLDDSVRAAIQVAVEAGDPGFERMVDAWQEAVEDQAASNPHVGQADLEVARRLAENALSAFLTRAGELVVEVRDLVGRPFEDLPWNVDASGSWLAPDGVISLRYSRPAKKNLAVDASDLVVAGVLAQQQGAPAAGVTVYDKTGQSVGRTIEDCAEEVHERARIALQLVRSGWLPWIASQRGPKLRGEPSDDPWNAERLGDVLGGEST